MPKTIANIYIASLLYLIGSSLSDNKIHENIAIALFWIVSIILIAYLYKNA